MGANPSYSILLHSEQKRETWVCSEKGAPKKTRGAPQKCEKGSKKKKKKKMTLHTILFNLFASIAIAAACGVIISENPIYSLIFLILVFCNATGLLLLFKVELLAMMFIIIYVGAIAVLFLFVVMMLNIKMKPEGMVTKEVE
jgi:hypothetical protein